MATYNSSNRLCLNCSCLPIFFDFEHLCDRGLKNVVFDIRKKYVIVIGDMFPLVVLWNLRRSLVGRCLAGMEWTMYALGKWSLLVKEFQHCFFRQLFPLNEKREDVEGV